MSKADIDEVTGVATTGHEWDGIKELDNPLPRWWLYTFYATILFGLAYIVYYPAIPLIEGATPGLSGQTNRGDLKVELAAVAEARAGIEQQIATSDLAAIKANPELLRYATAGGASLYKVFCTQCHGSGAQGAPGYPNLNDDDWIWGGDLEAIHATITHGVRNDVDEDTRFSQMPAFGDGILSDAEINAVANHVLSLSGKDHDAALAGKGTTVFSENCASCHGEDGKGMRDVGAPNLADALWLYGGSLAAVTAQVKVPKHGVMPPWGEKLGDAKVKQLTLYIHSLGGGE